ncbi:PREDICTED: uncharacterized protein LOC103337827 [Prunus mume]|uniref:Uncharacterized protein LOC103337827 n=1 Tax=Prunus mume TaxID=102107 RepID=A0ABM0PG96_PRUMU|nr:PREDICTED: uncharacterized protein LOC103337827 [Prunus mume]
MSGINRRFIPQWFDEFDWLEYSISKDAAFCLYCYLFKTNFEQVVSKHSDQARKAYRTCLNASIKCTKFLLRQGLAFRGHDESATSSNRGNYLELLQFLADNDDKVREVVMENAPGNLKLLVPCIKKEIVNSCALETLDAIMDCLKDRFFSILVDEARDVSVKEQMAMVLCYVDDKGHVIERFVGIQHVTDTTSSSLKDAIDTFFSRNGLSLSKLRGKGYDGASNMRAFENDCLITRRGLNQETSLKRAGDTQWNSHYGTLISIISMFSSVVHVLQMIIDDNPNESAGEANKLMREIRTFEFVFHFFLMKIILGLTNDLSQALQRKDQEIVNAMALVKSCKEKLHWMRNNGFDALVDEVSSFCYKHHIDVHNMEDAFILPGRSRRNAPIKTNHHHYRVELFIYVIDEQITELEDRFNEVNSELLNCLACLSPKDSFVAFDKPRLLRLAQFYPQDFSDEDRLVLEDQLKIYIHYVRSSSDFSQLEGIGDLAKQMVETRIYQVFNYVYLLITLSLVLPVATASVERAFSVMNIVKGPTYEQNGRSMVE